jgi:hypothetical protein
VQRKKDKTVKYIAAILTTILLAIGIGACSSDADVASENLSKAADNFEIQRRIVFYNGITGEYMLEVIGLCSIGNNDDSDKLSITCKIGEREYIKHYLGKSDNVTWFAEQLDTADVSVNHYRVTFKPQEIVPDIDFRGSTSDTPREQP